ncbi:hypothetical protein HPB51_001876 [Rhipicephalus microplus]|uniref:Uncharacterized protein n=1 Tax=Rhipicephalus microplus TaxID=6941 RepID=A0A9J6EEJ6_RHIMP|nr:hypothetical protein HPB51_001876 [Rhipicephalus microplus]
MTQQDVPRWESHVLCVPGAAGIAAPEEGYSGGSAGGSYSSDSTRLESASSIGEEDSDSGSWWSYPSECGSVVELNRAAAGVTNGFATNKHHDHSETQPNSSSTKPSNHVTAPSAVPADAVIATAVIYTDAHRKGPSCNPRGGAVILPSSPERAPKPRCVNGRARSVSDDNAQVYDVDNHGSTGHGPNAKNQQFEPAACRASVAGGEGLPTADHHNNQVNAGSHAIPKPVGKGVNNGRAAAIRKSALATETRHSAPSIVRHVTFKDLSASSGSEDDDYSSGHGRNRNSASYHGDHQQNNAEADLDDSGYLDGDSTSSSSDISPPSSLSWESAIDSSRKSHGRSADQQCFVDSGGGGNRNGTHSPPGPRCESRAGVAEERRTKNMNGMHRDSDGNSTLSFVQTEICVSQSVRREDSYEYYRNGTRIAKLNNVNQTSWSETSSTETTERCTPLVKSSDVEKTVVREQTTPQPKARQADVAAKTSAPPQPTRRVLPSVDGARKRQPEEAIQRRQSATRESGKQKKESAGGSGVRNVGGSIEK